jgi:hypothetical protein
MPPTYNKVAAYYKETGKLLPRKEFYESIAKDHFDEFDDYYTYLKKMEEQAEKDHKN